MLKLLQSGILASSAAANGPQVFAPSSNDWDYSFAGGGWTASGNALGDNTSGGGLTRPSGNDKGMVSLHTFDGDYDVELVVDNQSGADVVAFGMMDIADDANRTTNQSVGKIDSGVGSFWYREDGATTLSFRIANAVETSSTHTFADGSVVKFERRGSVIKVYDDGVEVWEFTSGSSNPQRFSIGTSGASYADTYSDIFFTDYAKIQRDGFYDEGAGVGDFLTGWANADANGNYYARRIPCTRSGNATTVKMNCTVAGVAYASRIDIYSDDGTSPVSLLGSSDTLTLNSTGEKTWTFSTPVALTKGSKYWYAIIDEDEGSGDIDFQSTAAITGHGTGIGAVGITSLTDNATSEFRMEVTVEQTQEPIPVHGTLFLSHSNTTDGSVVFTSEDQNARVMTAVSTVQHDTAQNFLGQSSAILFNGTSDYITVPDSEDLFFGGDGKGNFTIECWVRFAAIGKLQGIINKATSTTAGPADFHMTMFSANTMRAEIFGGTSSVTLDDPSTVSADTDYHFAFVRVGNIFNLHRDGVIVATSTNASLVMPNTSNTLKLGITNHSGTDRFLDGWMGEPRILNYAAWDDDFTPQTIAYP
jgi:hypothetical protein